MSVSFHQTTRALLTGLHVLIWVILTYGLLFEKNIQFLYFSVFLSVFIVVSWQISGECLLTHIRGPFMIEENPEGIVRRCASSLGIASSVAEGSVQGLISMILCLGFYRLHGILASRKDFV